jgi:hypothetical protein
MTSGAIGRAAVAGALTGLALAGLGACGGAEPAAPPAGVQRGERPPEASVSGVECPGEIRITRRPRCALVAHRSVLRDCPQSRVGHDLRVSGLRCARAYPLIAALGSAGLPALGDYSKSRLVLYRPRVATYHRPYRTRDTGWTCTADWEVDSPSGVHFVCSKGRAVIAFQFSG